MYQLPENIHIILIRDLQIDHIGRNDLHTDAVMQRDRSGTGHPAHFLRCGFHIDSVDITETECYNDIDGSQTTVYHTAESKTISVHNSNYIGAVYIESDVQLEQYFKSVEAR